MPSSEIARYGLIYGVRYERGQCMGIFDAELETASSSVKSVWSGPAERISMRVSDTEWKNKGVPQRSVSRPWASMKSFSGEMN